MTTIRPVTGVLVATGVFVLQLAALGWTAPDVLRGHAPFWMRAIPASALVSQTFEVDGRGLAAVQVEAEAEPGGAIDARLVTETPGGVEEEVARGRMRASPRCCVLTVTPRARVSAGRVRLELLPRAPGVVLALRVTPTGRPGGLAVNGRPIGANAVVTTSGAALRPLPGAARTSRGFLITCFALIDGFAVIAFGLWLRIPVGNDR